MEWVLSLSVLGGRWKRRRARVRTEAYTAGETTYVFGITAINAVSPVCFALDPPTLVQTSIATLFRNQPSVDFIHCYGLRLLRRREYPTDVVVWLPASMFSFFPATYGEVVRRRHVATTAGLLLMYDVNLEIRLPERCWPLVCSCFRLNCFYPP